MIRITTIFCCGILVAGATEQVDDSISLSDLWNELRKVKDELTTEKQLRLRLQDKVDKEETARKELQTILENHISTSESKIRRNSLNDRTYAASESTTIMKGTRAENSHDEYGCLAETIHSSCLAGATIQVTNATFGMYNATCTGSCCQPDPNADCHEYVSQNSPEDWAVLKALCDGQASCAYDYAGSIIDRCETDYVADYMHIFYDCLGVPEPENEQIGFTAHATVSRTYSAGEIIEFNSVQTNFGGHYNSNTYKFYCPYSGIYLFSVGINSRYDFFMECDIVRDNYVLAEAYAENIVNQDESRSHASALVIVECNAGQYVWTKTREANCYLFAITSRSTQFAGYLLHRY